METAKIDKLLVESVRLDAMRIPLCGMSSMGVSVVKHDGHYITSDGFHYVTADGSYYSIKPLNNILTDVTGARLTDIAGNYLLCK